MIEVVHYEKVNKNKIIGYVDIRVSIADTFMYIRKISHLQSGEKRWFNLPSFSRDKEDGTPQYFRIWELEQQVHNMHLLDSLSDKVKEYCQKNNIKEVEPLNFSEPSNGSDEFPF